MPKKFTKEYQPSNEAKKKPKRKTVIKQAILKNYDKPEDFAHDILGFFVDRYQNGTNEEKLVIAKELLKYIYPTKKDINANINPHDDFIKRYGHVLSDKGTDQDKTA